VKFRLIDSEGRPAPSWLAAMLSDADRARDPFWAARRAEYRIEVTA
jgi:hypothetical protein